MCTREAPAQALLGDRRFLDTACSPCSQTCGPGSLCRTLLLALCGDAPSGSLARQATAPGGTVRLRKVTVLINQATLAHWRRRGLAACCMWRSPVRGLEALGERPAIPSKGGPCTGLPGTREGALGTAVKQMTMKPCSLPSLLFNFKTTASSSTLLVCSGVGPSFPPQRGARAPMSWDSSHHHKTLTSQGERTDHH